MSVLHVRDVPDRLYRKVQKMAKAQGRSLSAEVIALLEDAVRQGESRLRHARLMADIRRDAWTPPPDAPDSVEVLRQLREERDAELAGETT